MTQEQAYQTALAVFLAGRDGKPMPAIEIKDEQHIAMLMALFNKGRKDARLPAVA